MSIVTLKKKFQAQYKNSSVGQPQFSLNGTRRSSGYVGQDMLGRSLVRSLSRNGALKGHGGCCGAYPKNEIKTSPEMSCLNNPGIVKSSSLNTNGLLMSKYRWIRRPQPFSVTKPNGNLNNSDQASYIDHIARKTISDSNECNIIGTATQNRCCWVTKTANYNANINSGKTPVIVKPDYYTGSIDASEYFRNLDKKCTANDSFKYPRNTQGVPFGGGTPNLFVPLNQ